MISVMSKPGYISPCRRIPHSDDFEILDCCEYEKTASELPICDNDCCMGKLPEKENFFYLITSYDDGQEIQSEYGIGEVYSYGDSKKAFKRQYAFRTTDSRGTFYNTNGRPVELNLEADYFVVRTYVPENYLETMVTPNSVLCTVDRFDPSPVELEDNTVLGRLNNTIQSIDGAELRIILTDDRIVSAVKESKKPLILATSRLELENRLTCGHIHLRSDSRPEHPQKGFLYYNDELDCLEVFTSQGWASVTTTPN